MYAAAILSTNIYVPYTKARYIQPSCSSSMLSRAEHMAPNPLLLLKVSRQLAMSMHGGYVPTMGQLPGVMWGWLEMLWDYRSVHACTLSPTKFPARKATRRQHPRFGRGWKATRIKWHLLRWLIHPPACTIGMFTFI